MLETICQVLAIAYARNWITSRDGNVSIRHHDRDHFYITPSGVRKQTLQPEQFKKISISKSLQNMGVPVEENYTDISSNLKPSGEFPMHFLLQTKINTDVRVILHLHPTYTVAALYRELNLPSLLSEFPELSRYTRVGPSIPMIPPITQELADACVKNIGYDSVDGSIKYNIIGMDRHGVVAVDTSPYRALEHIERLEHICKIVLASGRH
jgi:L-fuculose-phosphate aldolase